LRLTLKIWSEKHGMPNPLSESVWTDGGELLKAFDII